jgi:hypothetical protein
MLKRVAVAVSFFVLALGGVSRGQAPTPALQWHAWSEAAFIRAPAEHKFVLLDLEAVWCHWCHVMDDVTYHDPVVIRLLNKRYILVRVDQDSRRTSPSATRIMAGLRR